jgi:hypothetical protein
LLPFLVAVLAGVVWAFGSEEFAAQLFAVAAILLVTLLLFTTGRERMVALEPFDYGDGQRVESAGLEVPAEAVADKNVPQGKHGGRPRGRRASCGS